jgi:hypothetical protein
MSKFMEVEEFMSPLIKHMSSETVSEDQKENRQLY